jgi:hypothetical protein
MKLKFGDSVYKADLKNSIYQQSGANFGLTVNKGMLINNRPDGQTGIQQAANAKKVIRHMEKVQTMAEAVFLGNLRSEMMEGSDMD